jgi:nucleotide-binding universal stress UspA family protein
MAQTTMEFDQGALMAEPSTHPRVVVGYDGSAYSDAAVAWAARYAVDSGSDLELVTVWQWPITFGYAVDFGDYSPANDAGRMVQEAAEKTSLPEGRVQTRVLEGPVAAQLIESAQGAEVLVVGTRGHNDFSGLMLGSVSTYCTHHADCAVVVVRPNSATTVRSEK